ncbi:MAG: kynureninase [Phycisphaerales bacterium]
MTTPPTSTDAAHSREAARARDAADPMSRFRDAFIIPPRPGAAPGDEPIAYFTGNSLGLQPKRARPMIEEELDDWGRLAVEGHFHGRRPWYTYHEPFRDPLARIVGARPHEVVAMNSLTVNLHLMMMSFFQPEGRRRKIMIESPAFPSDTYAVKTHLRARGFDPERDLITIAPPEGEQLIRNDDIVAAIERHADDLALVMLGGVNFFTGQVLEMPRITEAAHRAGAMCGWDLAHGAGNVPLQLHDWDADFACWCSYKYLNGGPGAVSACFVHERHARNIDLPRFAGWWGNDPESRFLMHLQPEFVAKPDADGWQLSNPPVLGLTALLASLEQFDAAGMPALRERSLQLTAYLRDQLTSASSRSATPWFEVITPDDPDRHGAQLSIRVTDRPRERFDALQAAGVMADFREPDVIRAAPAPLYNSYEDCWRFADAMASVG